MSSARLRRRGKQLDDFVRENTQLHQDVEDLETGLFLHKRSRDDEDNSVRGLIRKEVGGSRWEHGGTGKLHSYKSTKDLEERPGPETGNQAPSKSSKTGSCGQLPVDGKTPITNGVALSKTEGLGINGDNNRNIDSVNKTSKPDKIMDLKSKVLHKASLKIIKRDNWSNPSAFGGQSASATHEGKAEHSISKQSKSKGDIKPSVTMKEDKAPGSRSLSIQNKTYQLEHVPAHTGPSEISHRTEPGQNLKTHKKDSQGKSKKIKDNVKDINIASSTQRSRLDIYESSKSKQSTSGFENTTDTVKKLTAECDVLNDNSANDVAGISKLPVKLETTSDLDDLRQYSSLVNNGNTSKPGATEIYIDPENFQIRVKSGTTETVTSYSGLEETKVFIQPSTSNATDRSTTSEKFPCSVLDMDTVDTKNEVRDIFGLNSLDVNQNASVNEIMPSANLIIPSTTTHTTSPFVLAKECDSEVEFWLRGLGLPDIEKYVKIFAENETDLLDLEFMSASQLHEMGVTCLGALNTIVHGIKHLRNRPVPKVKENQDPLMRHLQVHSIAWEDVDDETSDKHRSGAGKKSVVSAKKKTDNNLHKGTPKKNETSMKVRNDTGSVIKLNLDNRSRRSLSPGADHSNSHSVASSRPNSSRTHSSTNNKPSSARRRPPSAKQPGNQSPNTTGSQPAILVNKQPNTERKRMSNLEAKPTRGVLLNRRSSSLTRDGRRNRKEGVKKEAGDNTNINKQTGTRSRSRSADSFNCKAMASVHAAARKFEDKQQRDQENVKVQTKWQGRQKQARDEMAARHMQREKTKELKDLSCLESEGSTASTPATPVTPVTPGMAGAAGLENLVTVNILSPLTHKGPQKSQHSDIKSKTRVTTPSSTPTKKSLRRVEPPKRARNVSKTVDLSSAVSNFDTPILSTYKLGSADKTLSELESGHEADDTGSYTEIASRVANIQQKIKHMKSQATNGDEMTLTLVSNLQDQLQLFEHQLSEKEHTSSHPHQKQKQLHDHYQPQQQLQQQWFIEKEREIKERHQQSKNSQAPPKPSPRKKANIGSGGQSTPNESTPAVHPTPLPRKQPASGAAQAKTKLSPKQTAIQEILAEDVSLISGSDGEGPEVVGTRSNRDGSGAMSKTQLLDEMRKEKHEHSRQIRMLQTELKRLKHSDPASMMELEARDILYGPEDLIGEGAFSRVYRGQYQGTEVAVKRLQTPLQAQDRNYLSAEVSLLRELRHPHVVLLIGVCTTSKLPILVLEYMSHGSLYNHLHDPDQPLLDHAEYYQLARDIALGMNYLHGHRPEVLHLDLKSMNILMGQGFRAKIADFGFSKLRHEAGSTPVRRGKSHGTHSAPCWTAPELLDKGEVTSKADVYSFAIILWEMVTRKVPYENCSVFQVLEMVRKFKRPKLPTTCPQGLSQLIGQCWEQNPAKRPHFKDIIPTLDNLAFPPAWRALFEKAGVSEEALHNVESTRKILNMVTNTLGSEDSKMLQSFILPHTGHKPQEKSTSLKEESEPNETSLDFESDIFEITDRSSHVESEFTLRNLRESSTESDTSKSVSETDSDDDYSLLTSEMSSSVQSKIPRTLNVFVPSLNLEDSIKTTREEFHSQRGKIEEKSNWFCISLDDDNSYRETDDIHRTSPFKSSTDSPKLLPTNRTVTPIDLSSSVGDASFQERNSPSSKAKEYNIKEFLRIESIDNRRPNSPKKRVSLTKKLAERTSKSFESTSSMPDSCHKKETVHLSQYSDDLPTKNSLTASRKLSDTDRSFDSFFGLSLNGKMEAMPAEMQNSIKTLDRQTSVTSCQGKQRDAELSASQYNVRFEDFERNQSLPLESSPETSLLDNANKMNNDQLKPHVGDTRIIDTHNLSKSEDQIHSAPHMETLMDMPKVNADNKDTNSEIQTKEPVKENEFKIDVIKLFNNAIEVLADDSDSTPRNIPSIVTTPRNFDPSMQSTPRDIDSSTVTTPRNIVLPTLMDVETSASNTPRNSELTTPRNVDTSSSNTPRSSVVITPRNLENSEEKSFPNDNTSMSEQFGLISVGLHPKDIHIGKTKLNQNPSQKKTHLCDEIGTERTLEKKLTNVAQTDSSIFQKDIQNENEMDGLENELNKKNVEETIKYENTKDTIRVKLDLAQKNEDKPIKTPRKSKRKDLDNDRSKSQLFETAGERTSCNAEVKNWGKEYNSAKPEPIRESPFIDKINANLEITKEIEQRIKLKQQSASKSEIKFPHKHDGGDNNFTRLKLAQIAESGNMDNNISRAKPTQTSNSGNVESPKKNKIRVKLRKDPLAPKLMKQPIAPQLSSGPPSPIPPAPPPPPAGSLSMSKVSFSRSVQEPSPGMSIVDELQLRLSTRKSYAEGMNINKTVPKRGYSKRQVLTSSIPESGPYTTNTMTMHAPGPHRLVQEQEVEAGLVPAVEDGLAPMPSDGMPQFTVQSVELLEQRELLKSISKMHPDQLDDLSSVSQEQLLSIADILRKAVTDRRLAMGEDAPSVSQSLDSVSWSIDTG